MTLIKEAHTSGLIHLSSDHGTDWEHIEISVNTDCVPTEMVKLSFGVKEYKIPGFRMGPNMDHWGKTPNKVLLAGSEAVRIEIAESG